MSSTILFRFPFRAVTFQSQRFANNCVYKTPLQKAFLKNIDSYLMARIQEMKRFKAIYDPKAHVLSGVWVFAYKDHFTKKEGLVNSKVPDLENGKKMCQDRILKALGLDDKAICGSTDIKWAGEDEIIFQLNIVERDKFFKNIVGIYKSVLT